MTEIDPESYSSPILAGNGRANLSAGVLGINVLDGICHGRSSNDHLYVWTVTIDIPRYLINLVSHYHTEICCQHWQSAPPLFAQPCP